MRGAVSCCSPGERDAVLAALDREFVHDRGRRHSLVARFPHVLGDETAAELLILREAGAPAACCLVRPFDWHADGATFRGAMVGLVFTWPHARGRGHARRLLEAAVSRIAAAGLDFAVLWSSLVGFYERLGWQPTDPGCLGRLVLDDAPHAAPAPGAPPAMETARALEALRSRLLARYVARPLAAYRALPLPADGVAWHLAGPADDPRAWLALGVRGETRYVVDFGGDADALATLWPQAVADARTVYVNATAGDLDSPWLGALPAIQWQAQTLAFWRPLSARLAGGVPAGWHVPFFDRI